MATIELEEYASPVLKNGGLVPLALLPAANVRQVASGAPLTLNAATTVIAVTTDADIRMRVDKAGAATTGDPLLKAGVMRWFSVPARAAGCSIRFD